MLYDKIKDLLESGLLISFDPQPGVYNQFKIRVWDSKNNTLSEAMLPMDKAHLNESRICDAIDYCKDNLKPKNKKYTNGFSK